MVNEAQQKRRPFSFVIVYDVKRFGRLGNDEAGYYRHILRIHGVEVLYVGENFSGDATDDLLRPVKQWQAREESKDLSKVTIRGLLSRIEGGFWNGGAPPHGYDLRYESQSEGNGAFLLTLRFQPDGTKLVLDEDGGVMRTLARGERLQVSKRDRSRLALGAPDRVEAVRRIFVMSAEDRMGYRSIANALNVEGIPSPRGPEWSHIYSGVWTASTVRAILTNPLYVGDLVWNRRTDARFFWIADGRASERREAYGARLVPNPESDWISVSQAHPGIITRRLFEAAQPTRRGQQSPSNGAAGYQPGSQNGRRARYLLSGLAVCARCGGRYEGCRRTKGKRRKDGSAVRTYYYGCGNYIRKGRSACRFGAMPQSQLEHAVIETVLTYYEPYSIGTGSKLIVDIVRRSAGVDSANLADSRHEAEKRLSDIQTAASRLLDALTEGTRPFIDERLRALDAERGTLESKLLGLDDLERSRAEQSSLIDDVQEYAHALAGDLTSPSPETRIRTLRRCVERVVVDREKATIQVWIRPLPVGGPCDLPAEELTRKL